MSAVSQNRPTEGRISAKASGGTDSRSHISADQLPAVMSYKSVREAFVASVLNAAPPLSFHISQLSTVPMARFALGGTPPSRNSHSALVPLKYGLRTRPVRRRTCGR